MHIVETVLGNASDPVWKAKLADAAVDTLELSQWDAQKNRLRKDTRNGQTIAVSLDRDAFLHDGDVLLWNEQTKEAVLCKIDLCDVLVIDLGGLQKLPADQLIERCVQLGHALGNQHWPAVVRDGFLYVPMAVNRLVMNSVMLHHFKDPSPSVSRPARIAASLDPAQASSGGAEHHGQRAQPSLPTGTPRNHARDGHHEHDHGGHCRRPTLPPLTPGRTCREIDSFSLSNDTVQRLHAARGPFAFSSGVESAVQKGVVHDPETLRPPPSNRRRRATPSPWSGRRGRPLRATSRNSSASTMRSSAASSTRTRTMTTRMGKKLAEMGSDITENPLVIGWRDAIKDGRTPGTYPVSLAVQFVVMGLSTQEELDEGMLGEVLTVHQYGVAMSILNASLRLMRITHIDIQRVLYSLTREFDAMCRTAMLTSLDQMSNYAPMTDILAANHVKAHVRLFMS